MDDRFRSTVLNLLAAVAILAVFTYLVGWNQVWSVLKTAEPMLVFMAVVAGVTATLARGVTWKLMLEAYGFEYSFGELFRIYYAGSLANNVTPLGQLGGEPFISYLLSRSSDTAYERHFGAIFSADLLNAAPFYSLSVIGVVFFLLRYPFTPIVSLLAAVVLSIIAAIVVFLVLTWYRRDMVKGIAHGLERSVRFLIWFITGRRRFSEAEMSLGDRIDSFYATVREGLMFRDAVSSSLIVSHAARFLDVVSVYAAVLALGVKPGFLPILFVVPISSLAFYIPLPGGLGGLDVALAWLLVLLADLPIAVASATVVIYRLSTYGFIVGVGGLSTLYIVRNGFGGDVGGDEML